ncbi:MAG: cytochrome C biogenesis protein [Deltaproteobacteria bacterium]|nr:cytochrome C biogenesis protein [Deltaproteobacteria bacterium]
MWSIVRKDLAIERRTGEMLSSLLLLALLVVLLFAFSLEPERLRGAEFVAGILWTTLLLAGTLALNRSFVLEREAGAWTALALCPLDRGSIYLGKTIANLIFLLVAAVLLLPLLALFLGTTGIAPSWLLPASIVLGTAGFAAVGTLFSAMASRTRAREVLLPLLSFPILAPLLIAAARTTAAGLVGEPLEHVSAWLVLLGAFDLVFLTAGWLTFDYVLEE